MAVNINTIIDILAAFTILIAVYHTMIVWGTLVTFF